MSIASISIVTVSMNRTEHLVRCVKAVSSLPYHAEHIIIDYDSLCPVVDSQLPSDQRIKLFRVNGSDEKWWLTHSFNLAFSIASGHFILKLDADVILSSSFFDHLLDSQAKSRASFMCNRLTLQDWGLPEQMFTTNGLFFCERSALASVNGFNPYIKGWGWDEIDLYSRLFLSGHTVARLPQVGVAPIGHDDALRVSMRPVRGEDPATLCEATVRASKLMHAQNEKNRRVAIASHLKKVKWPTFTEYQNFYYSTSCLPGLAPAHLFSRDEFAFLVLWMVRTILCPTRLQHWCWSVKRLSGRGVYTLKGASLFLESVGVDLSLFC